MGARTPAALLCFGETDRRTAYSFTMFQAPEMSDEPFDAQHQSLKREFANIERVFSR
jgi:hypothetical protein